MKRCGDGLSTVRYTFVLQVKGENERKDQQCVTSPSTVLPLQKKNSSGFLPASGGLYSKSSQESVYDFHLLCQSFRYSLNQPVKDKGKHWKEADKITV